MRSRIAAAIAAVVMVAGSFGAEQPRQKAPTKFPASLQALLKAEDPALIPPVVWSLIKEGEDVLVLRQTNIERNASRAFLQSDFRVTFEGEGNRKVTGTVEVLLRISSPKQHNATAFLVLGKITQDTAHPGAVGRTYLYAVDHLEQVWYMAIAKP